MQTSDDTQQPRLGRDGIADPDHDDPTAPTVDVPVAPVDQPTVPDAVPPPAPEPATSGPTTVEPTAHPKQPGASDD